MELWVYLAQGNPYFLILKWKEWESSEQCFAFFFPFFKKERKNTARGFAVGLWELAKNQDK